MEQAVIDSQSALALVPFIAPFATAVVVLLLLAVIWHHARKIRRLEQRLVSQHRFLRQELKMMSQGAIGVGNRVKHLEKQIKQSPSAFEQLLMQQAESSETSSPRPPVTPAPTPVAPSGKSRAEQALSDWMRDYQSMA